MAKAKKPAAELVLAAAGSAKTKDDIAAKLDMSYGYVSTIVNALVKQGKLKAVKTVARFDLGRPATFYKRAA